MGWAMEPYRYRYVLASLTSPKQGDSAAEIYQIFSILELTFVVSAAFAAKQANLD